MCKTLKNSGRIFILFLIILILSTLSPGLILASEKAFRNSLGMEFVLIPAGTFMMGSPRDETYRDEDEVQHQVNITKPFYMQTTEVTLKQWRTLMGKRFLGRRKGSPDMPVVRVSWYDCMNFIKKLNTLKEGTYRLPTEAEWEYSCRAGTTTAYSWGNTVDCSKAMYHNNTLKENLCGDYVKSRGLPPNQPAPVKSYQPNAWGIYDMHGNVWEWCQDWYGDYPSGSVTDPIGPSGGSARVFRGGSFGIRSKSCRSAVRGKSPPNHRYPGVGFRLLRVP